MAYLKLAASAPEIRSSLLRIINTPARGIGRKPLSSRSSAYALHLRAEPVGLRSSRMMDEQQFPHALASVAGGFRNHDAGAFETGSEQVTLHEAIRFILDRTGYRQDARAGRHAGSRSAPGESGLSWSTPPREAVERGETVADFLDHAALVADADPIDEQRAGDVCMTLHNAKGLEFPHGFPVAAWNEGLFPHSRSLALRGRDGRRARGCATSGMTRAGSG